MFDISLDISGNQRGENSRLGWLIELPSQDIHADSLYFLMMMFFFQNSECQLGPNPLYDLPHRHVEPVWIFPKGLL
jgi:hypothetical protein